MSDDVNKHKLGDKEKRRVEHLEDKYEEQGMGRDGAGKKAMEEVAQDPSHGGGNAGADPPSPGSSHRGGGRRGSDKGAG